MESNLISICIPCYEMSGKGIQRIEQLIRSICYQNYSNFEIIISDHSVDDNIFNATKSFEFEKLNITYIKNDYKRGSSSANINSALKLAKGDIIKIMFQDDFFINNNALNIISSTWGVCGCVHSLEDNAVFYNRLIPFWQDDIKKGVNTVGGPSCLFFKKTDLMFDEDLLWFMDTDFYYRMYQKYGTPSIIEDALYCSRESSTSVSNTLITNDLIERETIIIKNKYDF